MDGVKHSEEDGCPSISKLETSLFNRRCVFNPKFVRNEGAQPEFSLVSYNILAECHQKRTDYSYTADEFLGQDYRHNLLKKELDYLNGDIVCLQEVNPDYYNATLLPFMQSGGYDGVFQCRTKEPYQEGEATFYRKCMFQLEEWKAFSLAELAKNELEQAELDLKVKAAMCGYLDRADVVLITRFSLQGTDRIVTVANVHVWWDEDLYPDVKCAQVACAIKGMLTVAGNNVACIICGDFNSDPLSPVYQLVTDGFLSDSSLQTLQIARHMMMSSGEMMPMGQFAEMFNHPAQHLQSAYTVVLGKPEMTCYTDREWQLDYIFYSAEHLIPISILSQADPDIIKATGGLPSRDFPSDHLSLKAKFSLK